MPIFGTHGVATTSLLELESISSERVRLRISPEFADREVDEELSFEAAGRLGGSEPFRFDDVLGLCLETDGARLLGQVGSGSAVTHFMLKRDDWNAALAQL